RLTRGEYEIDVEHDSGVKAIELVEVDGNGTIDVTLVRPRTLRLRFLAEREGIPTPIREGHVRVERDSGGGFSRDFLGRTDADGIFEWEGLLGRYRASLVFISEQDTEPEVIVFDEDTLEAEVLVHTGRRRR